MYKTMLAAAASIAVLAPAMADGLPPPPTETYVAPVAQVCNPTTLQVYFPNGEAALSDFARNSIAKTSAMLAGCALASVEMVSLSADGRTMAETTALANQRIDMVLAELRDQGLTADATTTRIDTDHSETVVNRPMARRVEITLAAYRPDIA